MKLCFHVTKDRLLRLRNDVFKENGLPVLLDQGFFKSPYYRAYFGKDDLGGITYELCRLKNNGILEFITIRINKDDRWIQIDINVFQLFPEPESLEQLKDIDGIKFKLPPNRNSEMRLTPKSGPIFSGFPNHKIGFFLTKRGFERCLHRLGERLNDDFSSIDTFFVRWLEQYEVNRTAWDGAPLVPRSPVRRENDG